MPHGYAFDGMKQRYVNGIGTSLSFPLHIYNICIFSQVKLSGALAFAPETSQKGVNLAGEAALRLDGHLAGLGWQLAWFAEMAWQLLFQTETSWGITLCLASLAAAFAAMGRTLFNMYRWTALLRLHEALHIGL